MPLGDERWLLLSFLCLAGIGLIIFAQHKGWIKSTEFPPEPPDGQWSEDFLLNWQKELKDFRLKRLQIALAYFRSSWGWIFMISAYLILFVWSDFLQ